MNRSKTSAVVIALMLMSVLILASCSAEKKPADEGIRTVTVRPGEAGGMIEDTFTASATISAIDASSRKITLTGDDGTKASFKAGPEIRNFDQLHVGDKVTATITERLLVFVESDGAPASATHVAAAAAAAKGAKPGAMMAEAYEVVATVTSIDQINRKATLKFVDGSSKTFPVRADVNLLRYKVGDSVIIQVTESLSVLVTKN